MQQEGRNPEETPIEEIYTLFRAQREAFHNAPMPSAQERIDRLKRLKSALLGFQEEFISAVDADFNGRSRDESLMAEVFPSVEGIRYAARRVRRWMRPRCSRSRCRRAHCLRQEFQCGADLHWESGSSGSPRR